MKRYRPSFALGILLAVGLAACGGGNEEAPPQAPAPTPESGVEEVAPEPTPEPEDVVAFDGPPFAITILPVGNEMRFEQTEFTVQPGQTVHITLNNTATSPAMKHSVVVLRSEDVIEPVAQAAMRAAATDYVPPSHAADIIAATPMSDPGETVEVTFTAPSTPGDYPYICTFPAHHTTMRGVMHVVDGG